MREKLVHRISLHLVAGHWGALYAVGALLAMNVDQERRRQDITLKALSGVAILSPWATRCTLSGSGTRF